MDPDLPRWWGDSTGRWEGGTFVVTTTGVDERTWVDHFGYPHSITMVLGERYRRTAYDVLELSMTIADPKVYMRPGVGETKRLRKLGKDSIQTVDRWTGLPEAVCAPADKGDIFDKRVRDPAGGVIR